ncbi:tautomerase family protein [Bradyrhizobium tropiciagri]|uniref:tautomerase family protein n=1 Tax=Bradyrhizobium tropiciagri TaxID=312253 RepID=UPI00067D2D84|nr:tautomerase family protein [Bradyrhizobium tropiciagri]
MPTYFCTSAQGRLTAAQKSRIAGEITRIHAEVTGAPSYFAQVIFNEITQGNWFMGGVPVAHDHIFVYGHIRSGRAAVDKTRMIKLMADAVGAAASVDSKRAVWIYLNELQPRQMIEFGNVLPEPGDEPAWTDALPEADRVFMQSITRQR